MNELKFSATNRALIQRSAFSEPFDLLVIGGGITGAGIALDAITRGLKVLLVEKKDFAWGTSSRSTKLIHGGLRYLKQMEFGLVHEVGVERAIVHKNAPHIVLPEKMLLPIIEEGSLGKMLSSLGLWVYDRLANVEQEERRKMLEKDEVAQLEPLLRQDVLLGGGLYYEYRTDDARLTIETLKTAVEKGAVVLNYTEVYDFIYKDNAYVGGAKVRDTLDGSLHEVKAKRVVNAAGPWVDTLRAQNDKDLGKKRLHLTKGVHIVVPYSKLPIQQSVYFDVEQDNRMIFAIPRGNVTYIGTTDTFYDQNIDQPKANRADVAYIIASINFMFPSAKLNISDVESTWAGLRPLIHQEGKSPSELSRRDEIFYSESGLISIAGGKLTGYRKMAERVLNFVYKTMRKKSCSVTQNLALSGGDFDSPEAIQAFIYRSFGESKQLEISLAAIQKLFSKYGRNISKIIDKAYELKPSLKDSNRCLLQAEVWYVIHYEMTTNLCDFFIRRTGMLYFERPAIAAVYLEVADMMASALKWSEAQKAEAIQEFEQEYQDVMSFQKA